MKFTDIDKEMLSYSLLKYGFFPHKKDVPPLFTSEKFASFCLKHYIKGKRQLENFKRKKAVVCRIEKKNNTTRLLNIPHPLAYLNLCLSISNVWPEIKEILNENPAKNKVSMFLPEYFNPKKRLFNMIPPKNILNVRLKKMSHKKFITKTDISAFYPSIYTHSIPWAILGKETAKKEWEKKKEGKKPTTIYENSNKIDNAFTLCQDLETIGIHIGPDASALMAEVILSSIDSILIKRGFTFIRFLDDYVCYTKSEEENNLFLETLTNELEKYHLRLNRFKTKIQQLPLSINADWVPVIRDFALPKYAKGVSFLEKAITYLDYAVELAKKYDDMSCIKYAVKRILNYKEITIFVLQNIENYFCHLCGNFPYLAPILPEIYNKYDELGIIVNESNVRTRQKNLTLILDIAIKLKQTDVICFVISTAICYKVKISKKNLLNIINTDDCLGILSALLYMYDFKKLPKLEILRIIKFAEKAIQEKRDSEFWILIYELYYRNLLNLSSIKDSFFKSLKKNKINFTQLPIAKTLRGTKKTTFKFFFHDTY